MNYYAVIDTNVLVSALLRLDSNPGKITIESLTGRIIPLLNEEILSEYREVLNRPKSNFSEDVIHKEMLEIIENDKKSPVSSRNEEDKGSC